ncbi:MAG: chlorite dismutase family protein [Chloroflexi bacterium]|nr:chlorite dismutase family protein [Chloroflexota bacterium]
MPQEWRQLAKYSFYHVDPQWRRLPLAQRRKGKEQVLAVVRGFGESLAVRSYSLVGLRGDADFLLWLVTWSPETIQDFTARVYATEMGSYLTMPYSYLAMARRSPYVAGHRHEGQEGVQEAFRMASQEYPYLILYPFVKSSAWYQLPREERQRMMEAHFFIGHKYPTVHINTGYSYGLDDQEHVVVFETTSLADFQDLVMELREAESRPYTLRDTPIFTCLRRPLAEVLDTLG